MYPMIDGATVQGGVTWSYGEVDLSAFADVFAAIRYGFLGLVVLGLIDRTKEMMDVLNKVVD